MMVQVTELVPWPYLADCESESGRSRIAALLVHQAAQKWPCKRHSMSTAYTAMPSAAMPLRHSQRPFSSLRHVQSSPWWPWCDRPPRHRRQSDVDGHVHCHHHHHHECERESGNEYGRLRDGATLSLGFRRNTHCTPPRRVQRQRARLPIVRPRLQRRHRQCNRHEPRRIPHG